MPPSRFESLKAVGKSCNLYYEYAAAFWRLPYERMQILAAVSAMRKCAGLENVEVELHLVDDTAIAALNQKFLGCAGPTNVLTFPSDGAIPGSLYLSVDCLCRESLIYGQNIDRHLLRLLAHGFGHLAGFEHGPAMAALENRCFIAATQLFDNGFLE